VGKSTIVNALSYALYGSALTNIRKDNLINKTNAKNMVVTLEFELDGVEYLVERGRRPNKFSFMVAGMNSDVDDADEAQGDSRITQQQLERELGLSHNMFKNIVALNTYSEPFLAMKAADQRELIEQLLGITKLSEKAEVLKEKLKETKDAIKEEEFRIDAVKGANKRIENNVESLRIKKAAWDTNQTTLIADTQAAISVLEGIDIEAEIEKKTHKQLKTK
jgi:DNA repair exonuclease SbcCD ATPase subunit